MKGASTNRHFDACSLKIETFPEQRGRKMWGIWPVFCTADVSVEERNAVAEGAIWRPKFIQLNLIHSIKADEAVAGARCTEAAWENSKSVETCSEIGFSDLLLPFAPKDGGIVMNWCLCLIIPLNPLFLVHVIVNYVLSNYLSIDLLLHHPSLLSSSLTLLSL